MKLEAVTELNAYRLKLPDMKFGTIYADPPWPLDQENTKHSRRRIMYDRMSATEIFFMGEQIREVSDPHAHLWMWTTNAHLPIALKAVEEWGFTYKTMMTWVKTKIGLGWWLRSRTEHLILAAKDNEYRHNPGNFTTELKGKWRGHSVKPEEAYTAIEALSPGPRLELFSRHETPREGWWYPEGTDGHRVPTDPFGQDHIRLVEPDTNAGPVRGVGGLEIIEGRRYVKLVKVLTPIPCTVLEQKGRRVKIHMDGDEKAKWTTIDSLRHRRHKV